MAHNKKNNKNGGNRKKHIGKIYFIDPAHVVKKNQISKYKKTKGHKAKNKRPVVVTEVRRGNVVQVSQMTTKATEKDLKSGNKVQMTKTYPNKKSYTKVSTTGKSRKTGKKFAVGKDPLIRENYQRKANKDDMDKYYIARKRQLERIKAKKKNKK